MKKYIVIALLLVLGTTYPVYARWSVGAVGGKVAAAAGCSGATTSYVETGGSGDRAAVITIDNSGFLINGGTVGDLINGVTNAGTPYTASGMTGVFTIFDFGAGKTVLINEAKWYQGGTGANGVVKWQGSNNGSEWTDIGNTFTLGGEATQTQTELSGNTTEYRYYKLLGVSGTSTQPYVYELEFKICGY